jgi:two-component system, NarL family, sensor kinase
MVASSEGKRQLHPQGGSPLLPTPAVEVFPFPEEHLHIFFSKLLQNCPVAVLVLSPQHRVQVCNEAFERLFQYSRGELLAEDLQEMIATNELAPEAIEIWSRVLAGERVEAATKRRRKDGTVVDVELHGIPVFAHETLIGVIAIYHDVSQRKGAELALHQLSARLLELQDEERRRIARELHDTTAQSIFALTMNLTRLQELSPKDSITIQTIVSESLLLAEQSAKELRTLSYLLHPPLLDDLGLVSAISWYARGFSERSGIKIDLDLPHDLERLPRPLETAFFRIVQEALTNVQRHSGSPSAAIRVAADAERVMLEISDQGVGLSTTAGHAPTKLGVGLPGMRERIHQLGGQFEIVSGCNGTTVRVAHPLPQ